MYILRTPGSQRVKLPNETQREGSRPGCIHLPPCTEVGIYCGLAGIFSL